MNTQTSIEKLLKIDQENQRKSSTIREFILLTLIHAEKRLNIKKENIVERIKELFKCRAIVIATEIHKEDQGKHYHVGIWTINASKNTLRGKLRKEFPEWQGRAIDISLHKGWGSICAYILKEDKEPLVWGEFSLDQIRIFAKANENKKEVKLEVGNLAILKKLEQIEDWYQIYRDEILANKVLQNLPRMKEAFEDLKILKEDIETNIFNRIIDYLKEKGNPKEYDVEELREKYLVIDWIACQLCFTRPIKTKQLFIYGEPSTQKTLLLHYLSKVIKIYFASSRKNDFAGANDYYDLWAFDEFHEQEQEEQGQMIGSTMQGSAFVNNLLKVLDGQECRLDSKYAKVFKKRRNIPIIMIANKLPQIMEKHGPFRARFFRIRFSTRIQKLEEERVIATLWGCLIRRIQKSPYTQESQIPKQLNLAYNQSSALIITMGEQKEDEKNKEERIREKTKEWKESIQEMENPIRKKPREKFMNSETVLITKKGEFYKLKPKIIKTKNEHKILIFEILNVEGEHWEENNKEVTLLNFANIPIKKREKEKEKKNKGNPLKKLFEQQEEKTTIEEEEKSEEDKQESIIRLNSIFLDKKEREWIRKQKIEQRNTVREGCVQDDEVWSVISVQRNKEEQEDDYAMWPLEIKILEKEENSENEKRRVYPAILKNIRKGSIEEQRIKNIYEELKKLMENREENTKIENIKCEISIARNGEKQPWNIEC